MNYLTKKFQWLAVLLTIASLFLSACGSDEEDTADELEESGTATIPVPQAYVFDSRFVEGDSSVSYSGQVVRNLLLQDLKSLTDSVGKDGGRPITVQDMLKLYEYDDALNLKTRTGAQEQSLHLKANIPRFRRGKILSARFQTSQL